MTEFVGDTNVAKYAIFRYCYGFLASVRDAANHEDAIAKFFGTGHFDRSLRFGVKVIELTDEEAVALRKWKSGGERISDFPGKIGRHERVFATSDIEDVLGAPTLTFLAHAAPGELMDRIGWDWPMTAHRLGVPFTTVAGWNSDGTWPPQVMEYLAGVAAAVESVPKPHDLDVGASHAPSSS